MSSPEITVRKKLSLRKKPQIISEVARGVVCKLITQAGGQYGIQSHPVEVWGILSFGDTKKRGVAYCFV